MARSILVTGGAGYIGSVVVEQLLALGHSVVVLDDLSRGHRAAVDPRAEFVRGGIADRRVLDELLARRACDALVHLAAYALVAESVAHPEMYFSNNVTGGRGLLIADAHVRALDADFVGAEAVNLGTGAGHSVLAVTEAARRVAGRPIPTVPCPRRPGDPPTLVAAPGRAEQLLGWRPRRSRLDEILASAWEWHRTHPSGYPN